MYFYVFFYLDVFLKNTNSVIRTTLPNSPKSLNLEKSTGISSNLQKNKLSFSSFISLKLLNI